MVYVWSAVGGAPAVVSTEVLWFDGPTSALVLAISLVVAAVAVLLAGLAGRRVAREAAPFPDGTARAWPGSREDDDEVLVHP